MNNKLRKIFAFALMMFVLVATTGLNKVEAAAADGTNIKMNGNAAVYYLKGGKRYVYPNSKTYFTWYSDFNNVMTVSQSELESYPLGGNVTYRPGAQLVKITTNPKVYAVGYNRTLHEIASEAEAIAMYGPMWNKMIDDLPDAFATNYLTGSPLAVGKYGEGQLLKLANASDVYYFDGTSYRKIASESAFMANRFSFDNVVTAPSSWTSVSPMGSAISGVESNLIDTSGASSSAVSTGTGLSVALASDTPASTSVPKGATGITYSKFNVTASNDGSVILQSVTVTRSGVGTPADFDNVYLYDGMTRLTTGRSINSSTNKATFNNLNLTIAAGTTKTLSIVADMRASGSTGSGSSSLGIAAASDITAGGSTVTGSFPVSGNMMGLTNVSAGTITIEKSGTLSNPKAGEMGAKVASFKLTAGSTEDLKVNGITLYQIGNISADKLSNFMLKQAGTTVATAASMTSNGNINLAFSTPYLLEKGASRTFELYADVAGTARANDTVRIYLDNSSDLMTVGQTYGFGAAVTRTDFDNSAGDGTDASWTTVQAAQVTISFQGPAVQDIAVQQQDVEMFRFTITSQSNIEVRNTSLQITAGGTGPVGLTDAGAAMYKDIKFTDVASNQIVAGPKDVDAAGNDTTQALAYTDTWNVNAGQTRTIKVTADVANFTPVGDETIKLALNAFGGSDIKNLDTNQFVNNTTDIVPSTSISGNTHRVKAGALTASLAGTPSLQTYINGATGVKMTGINLAAGTGKDLKVTSIKLTAVGANSCATVTNCVLNVKLWDGTTQVGQTKSIVNNAGVYTVVFDNLNLTVAKGSTKTLVASVDLNTLGTVAGGTTLRLNVAATSDIVAQDNDGNSVNVSGTVTGPAHNISGAGSLTMSTAPVVNGQTDSHLVVAGSADQTILEARFTAANEDLKASKLRVRVRGTASGDSAINEIDSIALYNGATRVTDWVVPSSVVDTGVTYATADFNSFSSDFVVPKDASKTLSAHVNYKTISNGARAGQNLTASIDGNDNFEFRGTNSNTVLTTGSDVTGATVYLYRSKPTLTNVALSNGVLTGGNQELYKFSVTADAAGVIDWRKIKFTSVTTNITATTGLANATLVDDSNQSVATCSVTGTTTFTVSCVSASDQQVAAGSTKVYTLKADLTLAGSGYGSVSTNIAQPSSYAAQDTYTNVAGTSASFVWSDESIVGHTTTSADYNNDFQVRTLPTSSQTLVKNS